ncbi:MAG: tRNA pseudouridine(38-40) synthase TruA [Clostridiaceae bacterium]
MKNIKLIIEFDGTNYCGWQRQVKEPTVQEAVEKAISSLTGETPEAINLTGCSRTDSGVHSRAFVANFKTSSTVPPERFKEALNSKLPVDIAVVSSQEVPEDFHSRYAAVGKTYCYTILNRPVRSPLYRNSTYLVKDSLNIDKMKEASRYFLGKHDFTAFKSTGSSVKTSVRTITALEVHKEGDLIKIYASADGFLYNMVRIIVGTLLEVGRGKIKPDTIKEIIESKDRTRAGICVPAQGLSLEKVFY